MVIQPDDSPGQTPAEPNPAPKRSHRTAWIVGGVGVTVLAIVVVVVIVVVNGGSKSSTSSISGPQSAPAEPPAGYDLSRIAAVANDFPPGFTVTPIPRTVVTQQMVDASTGLGGAGKPVYNPPQCARQPTEIAGAVMQGVTAQGPIGLPGGALPQFVMVFATHSEQPLPASMSAAPTGCDHVSVTINDGSGANGTDEIVSGPTITGVPTLGQKTHWASAPITGQPDDSYIYLAELSDKTQIAVTGNRTDPQLLQDLLVKAVSAIRGQ